MHTCCSAFSILQCLQTLINKSIKKNFLVQKEGGSMGEQMRATKHSGAYGLRYAGLGGIQA